MKYIELHSTPFEYSAKEVHQEIVCVNVDAIVTFWDHGVMTTDGGLILCDETLSEIKEKLRHI